MGSNSGAGSILGGAAGFALGGPMGAAMGAGIGGAIGGGMDAQSAAEMQARAARNANATQLAMFNQQRADQQPWREAGVRALGDLQDPSLQRTFTMADFQADPGYQFRMSEAQRAIDSAASARGGGMSTGMMRNLNQAVQGVASNEITNAYNRFNADRDQRFNKLSALAGLGQTANSQIANAGQNYANQYGQNVMGAANAQAAGQIASSNAMSNAVGQGMNTWMQYQMMNRYAPGVSQTQQASGFGPSYSGGGSGGYLGSGSYNWG